jgi:hypothetical protein
VDETASFAQSALYDEEPSRIRPRTTSHAARDSSFRDVEAKHEQFGVNARCSPSGFSLDMRNLVCWSSAQIGSSCLAYFGFEKPIGAKGPTMPFPDGFGFHQQQGILPLRPESTDCDPEAAIASCQLRSGIPSFHHRDLSSEGEVFQEQTLSIAQEAKDGSEGE